MKKKEQDLITIGYHKGEMDFRVSAVIGTLDYKQLKELREMIIVAIYVAEDMWRRNQKYEEGSKAELTQP